MKKTIKRILPVTALLAYFIANLVTIMDFPTIHSDELWLKGLTEEMIRKSSFSVTEPFYDLYPRVVHPFRWLYHSLEALFFTIFGSSAATSRMLSLVAASLALIVFYRILSKTLQGWLLPIAGTLTLALNIQFLYSARFGRQDSIILLLLVTAYGIASGAMLNGRRAPLTLALITLLGIGVHPNSFLIGMTVASVLIVRLFMKEIRLKDLVSYFIVTGAGFAAYIAAGNLMNPGFLTGYLKFGESLGIEGSPIGRLEGFYWFWYKLYHRIGGTYDLFDIRIEIVLMIASILLIPLLALAMRNRGSGIFNMTFLPWSAILGINLGLLVIGRYNQTSVVFLIPFIILVLMTMIDKILESPERRWLAAATSISLLVLVPSGLYGGLQSYSGSKPYKLSFEAMIDEIDGIVSDDSVVLGNLNSIDAFDGQRFYDIRNLAFLEDNGMTIEDYIKERGITVILLHEEMDYISKTAPTWDFLYGSGTYMDELLVYISEKTELIGEFENPLYAMRITRYSGTYPWKTRIYRVRP
ncbi:ArnT family glycosyltransferase [Youngiibacter multivorans]|uniref:Glycosyltransferase RgtA/B/C/D-like domain-containing protein n=1 Tax=Youngiibacter multivorans TaxID=937251 RepID=A0ABS4G018_9CLOT|nr:hypothetical protein [Youngiibacter multivorans]MBP1917887.1 hypothetical protein [Youngiibacter multivorans]